MEGDEAERPWAQVMRSLVGLYKNLNLTLESWRITEGLVMERCDRDSSLKRISVSVEWRVAPQK